jgi:hypothetical protein
VGAFQRIGSSPTLGAITMLPPLIPTQTARSDGKRSARADCRIQWHRYRASPPFASRTSVSWTRGTHCSSSMLGSAVSSSTPNDLQPSSRIGVRGSCPLMNRHAAAGPAIGCPYDAVGMHRASHSAIGLTRRSTSASWMLGFLMPAEVSRNFRVRLLSRRYRSSRRPLVSWAPRAELEAATPARRPRSSTCAAEY